jgi:phosphoribosylanthranilate isomerase
MGFIFVPDSPRFCGTKLERATLELLPASVKTIGVFRNAELDEVVRTVEDFGLHGVQLHGDEDHSYIEMLRGKMPTKILYRAVAVRDVSDLEALGGEEPLIDAYIFDSAQAGSGEPFEWGILAHYRGTRPYFLAGGIGLHNLRSAQEVQQWCPQLQGFDLNSKVEDAPGIKNVALVRKAIEMVTL